MGVTSRLAVRLVALVAFASCVMGCDALFRINDVPPFLDASPGDGTPGDGPARGDAPPDACVAHASQTYMGHHYFETDLADSWPGSVTQCALYGGHLVKIENSDENAFITLNFANGTYTWIGLSDPLSTDVYVWQDLTPLGAYNAFQGVTPPSSPDDCVDSNGTWQPYGCSNTNHHGTCECE